MIADRYYDYVITGVTPPDYSEQRKTQYQWLDNDLANARQNADWVIVYGHRPMYCSDVDSFGDCTSDAQVLREGYVYNASTPAQYGMDDIIARHNVDMYFTAHEHSYTNTHTHVYTHHERMSLQARPLTPSLIIRTCTCHCLRCR